MPEASPNIHKILIYAHTHTRDHVSRAYRANSRDRTIYDRLRIIQHIMIQIVSREHEMGAIIYHTQSLYMLQKDNIILCGESTNYYVNKTKTNVWVI